MRRTLIVLSWVLVALVASERVLALVERAERRSNSRLRRLVPVSVLEDKTIAAIRVEDTARGDALLFARAATGWRSLSHWGAPADEIRLETIAGRLLDAHGIARPESGERMSAYGLNPPNLVRVSFHGPRVLDAQNRDLLALVEIGARLPGGRGTYARLGGSPEVIAVDEDLREGLATAEGQTVMSLLDPRIVPGAWSARANIERIEVRRERVPPFELRKRARAVQQEDIIAGRLPWEWVLTMAGTGREIPAISADAFVAFLQQATHRAPIDPRPRRALGLDPPRSRIVLHPAEGPALELQIGGTIPGGVAVRNALTQSAFVVDPQIAALLAPSAEILRRREQPTIWDAALRPTTLTTSERIPK